MPEHPPLLVPGWRDVQVDDLDGLFVDPFPDPLVRRDLIANFRRFLLVLRNLGVTGMLWLDGSFVTEKPHPRDIDLVLFVTDAVLRGLVPKDLDRLKQLIHNKPDTKLRFKCDLYFCDPDDADWRSYWRGWFGYDRNEEPKGVARLAI